MNKNLYIVFIDRDGTLYNSFYPKAQSGSSFKGDIFQEALDVLDFLKDKKNVLCVLLSNGSIHSIERFVRAKYHQEHIKRFHNYDVSLEAPKRSLRQMFAASIADLQLKRRCHADLADGAIWAFGGTRHESRNKINIKPQVMQWFHIALGIPYDHIILIDDDPPRNTPEGVHVIYAGWLERTRGFPGGVTLARTGQEAISCLTPLLTGSS